MDSIFDKRISIYRNRLDTDGAVVTLKQFLFSTKHKSEILALRKVEDEEEQKRLKKTLPSATISGLFSYRDSQHLIEHSGFMCVDIDGQDNPEMDVEQTKQQLAKCDEIAYIGLSVRGKGLFCVIPIAYPERHEDHFRALEYDFMKKGLVIDPLCKDVCRMRFVSYDPNPYVNEQALKYTSTKQKPLPPPRHYSYNDSEETVRKVYELCGQIQDFGLDITEGYQNWFKVGSSLADLGEDGREAFHMVSRAWPKYTPADADDKFDNLLLTIRDYTIGTFFYICKDYGLL